MPQSENRRVDRMIKRVENKKGNKLRRNDGREVGSNDHVSRKVHMSMTGSPVTTTGTPPKKKKRKNKVSDKKKRRRR